MSKKVLLTKAAVGRFSGAECVFGDHRHRAEARHLLASFLNDPSRHKGKALALVFERTEADSTQVLLLVPHPEHNNELAVMDESAGRAFHPINFMRVEGGRAGYAERRDAPSCRKLLGGIVNGPQPYVGAIISLASINGDPSHPSWHAKFQADPSTPGVLLMLCD